MHTWRQNENHALAGDEHCIRTVLPGNEQWSGTGGSSDDGDNAGLIASDNVAIAGG